MSPDPARHPGDGWTPFLCEDVKEVNSSLGIVRIEGLLEADRKSFFCVIRGLSEGVPFFIKTDQSRWWVSTITFQSSAIKAETIRA